mmetsp:Transcript_50427/g.116398  ORF Transcript_50427/g.116398 Transcript_50427/m.116398 type:complete len:309 (-) Transcript_50427:313-1239(-)|eukprot:CAMPEP_0119365236 /NCGR_PEP_ID=MMETSP1334-20130426/12186_1 /TAXON_ID=127549 /ORGANISM="Calcidiscus leptoporus, Strain RCC1130" /LENGTH=308 /DNA_ID=CAMNT_0007381169 /DNA_START=58 /DNA_END=984 /DNA_ORIENTATION=-
MAGASASVSAALGKPDLTSHELKDTEPCELCSAHEKRQRDGARATACKAQRTVLAGSARVTSCRTVCCAAEALASCGCVAALVRRPLAQHVTRAFEEYVASGPRWPDTDELHPMEATHDRLAIIDFSRAPHHHEQADTLAAATGYGRNLPPRHSTNVASASAAIEAVLSVLPAELADVASRDASELLVALRRHTGRRQFILRLELVLGDTCQQWHRDLNISRAIVTYCGPGTLVADEDGVTRADGGEVAAVDARHVVQSGAGDLLLMKGGLWDGEEGRGAAHRAPTIGPVPACVTHRLMLKVDVSEDF